MARSPHTSPYSVRSPRGLTRAEARTWGMYLFVKHCSSRRRVDLAETQMVIRRSRNFILTGAVLAHPSLLTELRAELTLIAAIRRVLGE